jgi:hypothetical protein
VTGQQAEQHIVQQVIVPAYVWADTAQRAALMTHIGASAAREGQRMRENLDHENATVQPVGMKAQVAAAEVDGKRVSFVAYDVVPVDLADLVMVAVDFPVIPS